MVGKLSDVNFVLWVESGFKFDIYLDFEFDKVEVCYVKMFLLVMKVKGCVVWVDNCFVVMVDGGEVVSGCGGVLDVLGISFVIFNMWIK